MATRVILANVSKQTLKYHRKQGVDDIVTYCLRLFIWSLSISLIFNTKIYSVLEIDSIFIFTWGISYCVGPLVEHPFHILLVAKHYLELQLK
jgi:hypothetical protein